MDQNQIYYQHYYRFQGRSRWMEKIWSEAFGDDYPAGLEHYGYLTQHDLRAIAARLQLSPGSVLLDIGCGKGGPGLRLAEQLRMQLTGIDIIPEAVQQAEKFKESFNLDYPAQFLVGEFDKIPLPDQSVDSVISIDSLWAAPNKILALREVKRVMKPGAKFIFTHWDLLASDPVDLLVHSGLSFVGREDTPDWKVFQQKVYEGILRYQEELVLEMGAGADMLLYEAYASPPYLDLSVRRIYEWELR
jgi:ubiquinone/menaquinone biosynthesis C-methylase UbiE